MGDAPKRKINRLKDYDYSKNGAYFITICTQDRKSILGKIVGGGVLDAPVVHLSEYGRVVEQQIQAMDEIYKHITVDKYVIMPNHLHLIIMVCAEEKGTSRTPSPTNSVISMFVSTLKRFAHKQIGFPVFQRSFHDHVIRNHADYLQIWQYIDENSLKWAEDRYYCM